MICLDDVIKENLPCLNKECRHHISYASDLNCIHVAIKKNGAMKLEDIGNRLGLTAARIKQIEQETFAKMGKRPLLKVLNEKY